MHVVYMYTKLRDRIIDKLSNVSDDANQQNERSNSWIVDTVSSKAEGLEAAECLLKTLALTSFSIFSTAFLHS